MIVSSSAHQNLVDRLARRLVVARMALDVVSTPATVAFHVDAVLAAAEEVEALPNATMLPRPAKGFGSAMAALLAGTVLDASPVPDTVPEDWTSATFAPQRNRCGACGLVPTDQGICGCS
jgi:hypothetical protein